LNAALAGAFWSGARDEKSWQLPGLARWSAREIRRVAAVGGPLPVKLDWGEVFACYGTTEPRSDLSDLIEKIDWCRANQSKANGIAEAGQLFPLQHTYEAARRHTLRAIRDCANPL
jgi:hypothetical protein